MQSFAAVGAPTQGTDAGTGAQTHSFTCPGNARLLMVTIFIRGAAISADPSYAKGGFVVGMTQLGHKTGAGHHLYMYAMLDPDPGPQTFTNAGGLAGATDVSYSIASYTGSSSSGQPDATPVLNGAVTTSITTSITTVADNCWVFLAAADFSQNNSLGAGAGATGRAGFNLNNYSGLFDSNGPVHPAGSYSMTITSANNDNLGIIMVSYSPAADFGGSFLENFAR